MVESCLEENGLNWSEDLYEPADMSTRTQEPAGNLLRRNPDVQAVFCVNDASASGLYDVLREKGLEPGKDVYVFAFDNGPLAANLNPPLASIGADGTTLGRKAKKCPARWGTGQGGMKGDGMRMGYHTSQSPSVYHMIGPDASKNAKFPDF